MRRDNFNMQSDNSTFDATIQHACGPAGVTRARELDRSRRTRIKMAEEAHSPEENSANFYRFAYSIVEQTIAKIQTMVLTCGVCITSICQC